MNVLGISAFYHDSAACLVQDGKVTAAAQEERFSRRRFDASLPLQAIDSCLELAGLTVEDVDVVAFYEKPLLRFDRAMTTFAEIAPAGRRAFARTAPAWMGERLRLESQLAAERDWRGRIVYVAHHEAHAASAFLPSPFVRAAILTVDGVGEWTTNALGRGWGSELALLEEIVFPHSLGLLYAGVTEYLGFDVNSDEYKVMGLAAYGEPRFAGALRQRLLDLRSDGSYRLDLAFFRFAEGERTIDARRFADLFGAPPRGPDDRLEDVHADIAASVQALLEETLLLQARHVHARTGERNLVLAGGVTLNAVANGRLAREGPFERIWIQPAAGDAGGALGAALLASHRLLGVPRTVQVTDAMAGALLGPSFDRARCLAALAARQLTGRELEDDALDREVATRLAAGEVVGWFQGRMEFGPRALGSRSILADPRRADGQARVNERIKLREGFRPFAPAVLEERAHELFDLTEPSPYMLVVAPLTASARVSAPPAAGMAQVGQVVSTLPAVTHVDGTARVQTVNALRHPRFHRLLARFAAESGCPALLNTSFNLRGEPVVCTPEDALHTFLASEMDALALGPFLVERPPGPSQPLPPPPPRPPSRGFARTFVRDLVLVLLALAVLLGLRAFRHAQLPAAIASGAALLLALSPLAPPVARLLGVAARAWQPVGAALAARAGTLAFTVVHVVLLTPLGRMSRRRRVLTAPCSPADMPSYWRAYQPPRGAPERMS